MEIGDIKKVRNSAGIFTMKLIEIINNDIGNTYGSLGEFKKLRIEFYKELKYMTKIIQNIFILQKFPNGINLNQKLINLKYWKMKFQKLISLDWRQNNWKLKTK